MIEFFVGEVYNTTITLASRSCRSSYLTTLLHS